MSMPSAFRRESASSLELSEGVRLAAIRYGTPGDDHYRGSGDFDMSQGGDDRLQLKGAPDTVYFGAAFTGADRVNGGKGVDVVTLDGDYSAGIEVQANSLFKFVLLVLEGGSYVITGELWFEYGSITTVDATTLAVSDSLDLDVVSAGSLRVLGGAGDDIIHASRNGADSYLVGFDGDDTLIGGLGASVMAGTAGADMIVMSNSGDIAQYFAGDSTARDYDTIQNLATSGGRIELALDSDTTTFDIEHDFHLGRTADRVGDVLVKYDAGKDETIVKVFTDHDKVADLVLHLTGDVPLTAADFIFG